MSLPGGAGREEAVDGGSSAAQPGAAGPAEAKGRGSAQANQRHRPRGSRAASQAHARAARPSPAEEEGVDGRLKDSSFWNTVFETYISSLFDMRKAASLPLRMKLAICIIVVGS